MKNLIFFYIILYIVIRKEIDVALCLISPSSSAAAVSVVATSTSTSPSFSDGIVSPSTLLSRTLYNHNENNNNNNESEIFKSNFINFYERQYNKSHQQQMQTLKLEENNPFRTPVEKRIQRISNGPSKGFLKSVEEKSSIQRYGNENENENDEEEIKQQNFQADKVYMKTKRKMENFNEYIDLIATLQQQLVYKYATEYKYIPRVTYFTCRKPFMKFNEITMNQKYNDDNNYYNNIYNNYDNFNKNYNNYNNKKQKQHQQQEQRQKQQQEQPEMKEEIFFEKLFKKKNRKLLQGLHNPYRMTAILYNYYQSFYKNVTLMQPPTTATVMTAKATTSTSTRTPSSGIYSTPSSANIVNKTIISTDNENTKETKDTLQGYLPIMATETVQKRAETTTATMNETKESILRKPESSSETTNSNAPLPPLFSTFHGNILIKILHIDHLINTRQGFNSKNKNYNYNYNNNNNRMANNNRYGRRFSGGTDTYLSNGAWLDNALKSTIYRQIVVLDLACGPTSRKLLELASNKMYFNAFYHWLLIEDFAFKWQTNVEYENEKMDDAGTNDDEGTHSEMAADSNDGGEADIISKNIVNGSYSYTNENVKSNKTQNSMYSLSEIETETEYIIQNLNSGGTKPRQRMITPTPFSGSITTIQGSSKIIRMKPNGKLAASDEDEEDIPIEKFFETMNFFVNSEVTLAKRIHPTTNDGEKDVENQNNNANKDIFNYKEQKKKASSTDSMRKFFEENHVYQLFDVWNPGRHYGGKLNISDIGNMSLLKGLQLDPWFQKTTTVRRRMNMNLARIRCITVVTNKNMSGTLEEYLTTPHDPHVDSMNRFNFNLLTAVRDMFNMSFVMSKTSTWGYLKNGKFDGMIGALVRKQADIGGSPIFFRLERAKVIDYTARTWTSRPCFMFRHPRSTKKDRVVFLQPFSNDVWVFMIFCGFCTVLLLWLLTSFERKVLPNNSYQVFSGKGAAAVRAGQAKTYPQSNVNSEQETMSATEETLRSIMKDSSTFSGSFPQRNGLETESHPPKQRKIKWREELDNDEIQVEETNYNHNRLVKTGDKKTIRHFIKKWKKILPGKSSNDASNRGRVGLLLESLLFYIGLICQQGLSFSTNFLSGRCIVFISLLFAFSIYQFYSASIVSTLLMEKPKTIRTLADLTHSTLEIGVEDIVYNRDYFLRTKDPDAIELYAKKVTNVPSRPDQVFADTDPDASDILSATTAKPKSYREILHSHETGAHAKTNEASNWYEPEYGMAKVKRGKFAFHVDVATAYKIIADTFDEREVCDLTEIQMFPPQKCVGIVQKGSPLKKSITYGLRRVVEAGIMDYQFKVWHSPKPRCTKQLHSDDLQVDMQTLTSAMFVLLFGMVFGLFALAIEFLHFRMKHSMN